MHLWNKLFIVVLVTSFFIISCESTNEPANNEADLQTELATNEAKEITTFVFNSSFDVIKGHNELLAAEGLGKVSADDVYMWYPETGWHIWEDEIAGENTYDHYKRGQQYFDFQGNTVKKLEAAVGMNFYFMREGSYGYVGDDPSGTSSLRKIGSEENPAVALLTTDAFIFSSTGYYEKKWDGYFSSDGVDYQFVNWHTIVDVNIEQLVMAMTEDGLSVTANGAIDFTMEPDWSAKITANGDVASGVLMYKGAVVKELEYSVADLLVYAQGL